MDCSTSGFPVIDYLLEGVCSNSCPLSSWCYLSISFSVIFFSFCLPSFPASGSFPVSQPYATSSQSIGVSASVLPRNQPFQPPGLLSFRIDWLDFLMSKGLSRVFSSTIDWEHRLFCAQLYYLFIYIYFLWSNSHICAWLLEKIYGPLSAKWCSAYTYAV